MTLTAILRGYSYSLIVGFFFGFPIAVSQEVKHSLFIAGPDFTGIIDEEDHPVWDSGRKGARDGFILSNGNALIAWSNEVVEFDKQERKEIFRYKISSDNREIGTVQRLPSGNTLITELGMKPRILEVKPDGAIAIEVPMLPETDNAHMQTRMVRKLANGNYLAPHLLAFKLKEYAPDGKVVAEFKTDLEELGGRAAENWPFTAIRFKNGNTLVNLTHGNKTVELDPSGKVIWKISNEDYPEKPFADPCGGQRLPNGNTVIASYGAKDGVKLFEVTPDKKMVWKHMKYRAHEFQVLTTNGKPIEGEPMK